MDFVMIEPGTELVVDYVDRNWEFTVNDMYNLAGETVTAADKTYTAIRGTDTYQYFRTSAGMFFMPREWLRIDDEPETLFSAYERMQRLINEERARALAQKRYEASERLRYKFKRWAAIESRWADYYDARIAKSLKAVGAYAAALVGAVRKYPDRMDVIGYVMHELGTMGHDARFKYTSPVINGIRSTFRTRSVVFDCTAERVAVLVPNVPEIYAHCAKLSDDDPLKIAYYPTVRAWLERRATITTLGRYLNKYLSVSALADRGIKGLEEAEIKRCSDAHRVKYGPLEVKVARTRDECIRVIAEGPTESCMANGYYNRLRGSYTWFTGHIHPAAVYGTSDSHPDVDTEVLYAEDSDGTIVARVICDKRTKACARIYGDRDKMLPAITKLGYSCEVGALIGCRIAKIRNEHGSGYIMPYVDGDYRSLGNGGIGHLSVNHGSSEYWVLDEQQSGKYSTYIGYERKGVLLASDTNEDYEDDEDDTTYCPHCGSAVYDPDDVQYCEHDNMYYCPSCEGEFVTAYTGRYSEFVHREGNAVFEYDGRYYTEAGLEWHGLVEYDGDIYSAEDMAMTPEGYVPLDFATSLDVPVVAWGDEYSYASQWCTTETHDGRVIHSDAAVKVEWWDGNTYVLHSDDDPAEFLPREDEENTCEQQLAA